MAISTKLIAVIVVALIAVGGAAAFVLLDDEDSDNKNYDGRLQVFGNVNNDDYLDNDDLKKFDEIKDDWNEEEYPYADADRNGKLDDADRELIQKMINKESCEVRYINGLGKPATVSYPINTIAIAGTMVHPVINALSASSMAVAKTGKTTSLDKILDAPTYNLPSIGSNAYTISEDEISKYSVDAVVTLYSTTYNAVETALNGTGIDCIRINPESSDVSLNTYLLMGFLLQKTDRSEKIVAFYDKYNEIIADKVSSIFEKDIKTTLTMYSYSMCGTEYYLTKNTVAAGTKNLSDFDDVNSKSLKNDDTWAVVDKYQADYIFEYSGWGMRWDEETSLKEEFDYYGNYFKKYDCYPNNYVVINKTMPDIARVAFVAQIVYPDVFGTNFAYNLYQDLVETFYPYIENYDVTEDAVCFITYDMVKDLA